MVKPELALLLIPLLPLAAGLLAHLLRSRPALAAAVCIASLLLSGGLTGLLMPSLGVTLQGLSFAVSQEVLHVSWSVPWISLAMPGQGGLEIPFALSIGLGQLLFLRTTALLAAGILLYSLRERRGDPRAGVFYANLTLFAGSMLLLLSADTLLLVYVAWEVMGLMSFILIAHSATAEARRAARQAFWTTRATDMGLLFAIFIMMLQFGWTRLSALDPNGALMQAREAGATAAAMAWLSAVGLLVLLAVIGKSAQWPLSFWLSDAMAAPAPVSALLHAATLVAAGPYLLVQLQGLYLAPVPLAALTTVGIVTMLLGGLMALQAREAKRVLAYSTVSQLGLCILGVGLFHADAAFFQLLVHAWCKAALFLAVGILAAQWHERRLAGAHREATLVDLAGSAARSPAVYWALVFAAASLAGVPFLGGAWGKEQLFWAAWTRAGATVSGTDTTFAQALPLASAAWRITAWLMVIGLALTAAYLTRLVWALVGTAHGRSAPLISGAYEESGQRPAGANGWTLATVVALLCALLGSVATTILYFKLYHPHFVTEASLWQWMPEKGPSFAIMGVTTVLTLGGVAWGAFAARGIAAEPRGVGAFFAHGMYLREFWQGLVTNIGIFLAVLFGRTESNVVEAGVQRLSRGGRALAATAGWLDQHFVDGVRWQVCELWWRIRRWHGRFLQTGDVQHYMFVILVAAVILCLVVVRPLSHIFARMLERM